MGLFDKKYCDICGEKIGLLGNRKLDDGNLCKECAKKLSPWFEERRHSTVDSIKEQLAYREANKSKVRAFQITREFAADRYHVFIDDTKGQFAIARAMNVDVNPDIVDLSQIISCKLDVQQNREEEQYRDKDGNLQDYVPPRYKYSYDYSIKLAVSSPWFDDMDFDLSSSAIDEQERQQIMEMENTGNQIVAALTGMPLMNNGYSQPMGMQNNGYGQPMGMQNNGYGQPMGMQNNGYGQPMGMQNNGYTQPMNQGMPQHGNFAGAVAGVAAAVAGGAAGNQNMNNGSWQCSCGMVNSGKFCAQCGQPRPAMNASGYSQMNTVRCNNCGWQPSDPSQTPKFCPECGNRIG